VQLIQGYSFAMDHRLEPTLEAVESTRSRNWTCGFYENRHGVRGVWIRISFAGQLHKISIHNCPQVPAPDELVEVINGVKRLDSDRTWVYETRSGISGFSTTAWSNVPLQGATWHAVMISRSHEFTPRA
jgi:hypothetical protein